MKEDRPRGAMPQAGRRLVRKVAGAPAVRADGAAPVDSAERIRCAAHGGLSVAGLYANAAGARPYKLYVATGASRHRDGPPLLVMLHGCKQDPDDFAAGTRMNELAESEGWLVLWPAQPASANASGCWNWFNGGDQRRDAGEPSLIAGITREAVQRYGVDARRVYVAGLSAGGAMAATMAAAYPDLYAACGVHSGLPHAAAHDALSALAAMRRGAAPLRRRPATGNGGASPPPAPRAVPTIVFHGDRDATVHPCNADAVVAQARARVAGIAGVAAVAVAGADPAAVVEHGREPGRHAYTRTVHRDARGRGVGEQWLVHGAGHAWSGGNAAGSFTDPRGPDASREMLRFFAAHPNAGALSRPARPAPSARA